MSKDPTPYERLMRIASIAEGITSFCEKMKATAVYVEEYAYSQVSSHATGLGEVGGVVKLEIYRRLGIISVPIVASSARKMLLMKCPQRDPKPFVQYNVQRLGGPTKDWTGDEIDAFVVANAGLADIGGMAMSFPGIG